MANGLLCAVPSCNAWTRWTKHFKVSFFSTAPQKAESSTDREAVEVSVNLPLNRTDCGLPPRDALKTVGSTALITQPGHPSASIGLELKCWTNTNWKEKEEKKNKKTKQRWRETASKLSLRELGCCGNGQCHGYKHWQIALLSGARQVLPVLKQTKLGDD